MNTIKFMWNGIKVDGKLYTGYYGISKTGAILIHAKDYGTRFPDIGIEVTNDSDAMTDYFEKDTMIIPKNSVHYENAVEGMEKNEKHREMQNQKWLARCAARRS